MADPPEQPAPGGAPPRSVLEDEVKFAVHGLFTVPELLDPDAGICSVQSSGPLLLRATYLDTPDLRLARAGVTLRHRTGEGRPCWHLKLPVEGGSGHARREFSVPAAAALRAPPDQLTRLVTALARGVPLGPVAVLRTHRLVWSLRAGDDAELAEVVDDTVSVVQGRRVVARFREVEVERRDPGEPGARAVTAAARALTAAGAITGQFLPKVVQALGPRATAPEDIPPAARIRRRDPAALLVAESLRSSVRRLVRSDVSVRLREPDSVHQMRVACRRLRSDLRTFTPLLEPTWAQQLREEIAWLATALGDSRDLEVLRSRLVVTARADPLVRLDAAAVSRLDALLVAREEVAALQVTTALDSPRLVQLLDTLIAACREPVTTPAAEQACATVLTPLVATTWSDLAAAAGKLTRKAADARWHAARIRAKR
ncbi:MAG: CYTH and CHAD domain-containing protein, partial [Mycobacteriales bacterium]